MLLGVTKDIQPVNPSRLSFGIHGGRRPEGKLEYQFHLEKQL